MKVKNRLYISIPITGHDIEEVKKRAETIKQSIKQYYDEVITPFDVCDEKGKPYQYYMGKDIEALLCCSEILMTSGWMDSKGCRAEREIAKIYGIKISYE